MPKTEAQYKRAQRARKQKAGLIRLDSWYVTPAERDYLRKQLNQYRNNHNGL